MDIKKNDNDFGECSVSPNTPIFLPCTQRKLKENKDRKKSRIRDKRLQEKGWDAADTDVIPSRVITCAKY